MEKSHSASTFATQLFTKLDHLFSSSTSQATLHTSGFTQQQKDLLNKTISQIPEGIQMTFNEVYAGWQKYIDETPSILFSSSSRTRGQGPDFERLVEMGKTNKDQILPLLVRKLMDPSNFFAHTIYEAITGEYIDSPLPQYVAQTYAFNWLQTHLKL